MRSSIFASLFFFFLAACGGSSTTDGGLDGAGDAAHDLGGDATSMDLGGDASSADLGIDAPLVDLGVVDAGDASMPGDGGTHAPMFHRPSDAMCTATAPPGTCSFGGGGPGCSMDSDCTDMPEGRCNMSNGGALFCFCSYDTCATDTDCPSGQTCACHGAEYHGAGNECIPSGCRVDADCGASGYCSPSRDPGGCGGLGGYFCHTAADTCVDDSDCTSGLMGCEYDAAMAHWRCQDLLFCP